jgi:hypothetical protein
MTTSNYVLSDLANARVFKALEGYWLEVCAQDARQMFDESVVELCIFHDDSETMIESKKELEKALSENQMIVVYLGDLQTRKES